jgi:hypothetical protein
VDVVAAEFSDLVTAALQHGELDAIPDAALRRVMTAAVKAYAAKAEAAGGEFAPFEANEVTATETAVTACAIMHEVRLFVR